MILLEILESIYGAFDPSNIWSSLDYCYWHKEIDNPDLPVRRHVAGPGLAVAAVSIPIYHRSMLTL